jgi:hypothetical protein
VSHDDVLFGYRLRLFTLAQEIGVRPACWAMAFTTRPTTAGSERSTAGASRPCGSASAAPRMPNQIGPHLQQRVMVFALAYPGFGPRRISAELRRPKWGGIRISEHGVWRVLRRFNLNTRAEAAPASAGAEAAASRSTRPPARKATKKRKTRGNVPTAK